MEGGRGTEPVRWIEETRSKGVKSFRLLLVLGYPNKTPNVFLLKNT